MTEMEKRLIIMKEIEAIMKKHYYWVTVPYCCHFDRITVREGLSEPKNMEGIPHFDKKEDAEELLKKLKDVLKGYNL